MRKSLVYLMLIFLSVGALTKPAHGEESNAPWQCGTPLLIAQSETARALLLNVGQQPVPNHHLPANEIKTGRAHLLQPAPAAPVQLGQIDRFFIHIPEMEVKATCIAIGEHLYVYVENSVRHLLTNREAVAIAAEFDARIYPEVRKRMGSEFRPGLDRDNRITLLMHDVGMNASGRDYGGYFAPADQLPTAHNSNRREMLFMDIYQFRERTRHTFYSSLAHEFGHLVNWFQNGGTTDQRWLEEGIACFAEWAVYGTVHTIYVDGYLAAPDVSLTYANTPNVYYGGAFLMLLYLYEQYGGAPLIRRIVEADALGQQAIENALATTQSTAGRGTGFPRPTGTTRTFADVFLNWGLANWLNDNTRTKQFGYQNLRNRKVTATVQRVRSYPISADTIPIKTWGAHYILFQNLPETLEIALSGNEGGNLYAAALYLPAAAPARLQNAPTQIAFDAQNNGKTRVEGLQRNGQIILTVTADAPQTLRYVAVGETPAPELPLVGEPRQPTQSRGEPQTVTFSLGNRTQPSAKKTNVSYILEPMTQLHLASDYHDIALHEATTGEPYLYAASDWGLEIFALMDAGNPVRVGEIATPRKAQAVAVNGNTAYVADGEGGVHLIAINSPPAPRIVKTLGGFTDARKVHIVAGKVYVLDSERGLLVFNQPDTLNVPTPRPRRSFKTAGMPLHISIADDAVYLSDSRQGLHILKPSPLGNFVREAVIPLLAHDFVVTGTGTAYIAGGNLRVVDFQAQDENPPAPVAREPVPRARQPEVIASLGTPGLATGIQVDNGTVYLTDRQAGLHLINVRNPQQPQWISSQPTFGNANDVALWRDFAYIADGKGGIQTIDVSTPNSLKWIHRYAADGPAYGLDVVVQPNGERTVYIANGAGGLKTVVLTTPYEGTVTQALPLPASATTARVALAQSAHTDNGNHYGFIATETGMSVVDLAGNTLVTHIPTENPVMDIALHEGYAYLCAESLIIVALDRFVTIAERDMRGSAYRIAVDGSHAYVAALEGGMHIFDITEPAMPRRVSSYATQGNATEIAPASERAYLLDSRVGVVVLDVTEPDKPRQVGHYANAALPIDAKVHEDALYLLDSESLQIIETHTLTAISRFEGLRYPFEFKLVDTAIYVADLYQLRVFQVHPHRFGLAVEDESQFAVEQEQAPSSSDGVFHLGQNFPNPFNPETWIPYQLAAAAHVTLSIYDAGGRRVHVKVAGHQRAGAHTAYWDGRNATGEPVASGIYFYTIEAGHFRATRKMFIQR